MNICFFADHSYWSQISNNGGTATILRSVATLRRLGHKVNVVASKDKFTWFDHPKPIRSIPADTNACIAVTVSDIDPMLKLMPKRAKAYWWCRLIENHQMAKRKLLKKASKVNLLVNSQDLQTWFSKHGIGSEIVYQGVDVEKWHNLGIRQRESIGFLVSSKKRKNFDFAMKIINRLEKKYCIVGYGSDLNPAIKRFIKKHVSVFKKNANKRELNFIYNKIGTWVCTSTKEGLHNPPIEAGLCGCSIVYPDAPLAGCSDHCIDGKTAWKYKALDVDSAIEAIEKADGSLNTWHKFVINKKIGDRKQAMLNLITKIGG